MDEKQFELLKKDLDAIKKLLALLLRNFEVQRDLIASAMGISPSRLSQIIPLKKYKKSEEKG
jgi:hypothetical protein